MKNRLTLGPGRRAHLHARGRGPCPDSARHLYRQRSISEPVLQRRLGRPRPRPFFLTVSNRRRPDLSGSTVICSLRPRRSGTADQRGWLRPDERRSTTGIGTPRTPALPSSGGGYNGYSTQAGTWTQTFRPPAAGVDQRPHRGVRHRRRRPGRVLGTNQRGLHRRPEGFWAAPRLSGGGRPGRSPAITTSLSELLIRPDADRTSGADIGRSGVVSPPERAVKMRQIPEATFEGDCGDRLAHKARIDEHGVGAG